MRSSKNKTTLALIAAQLLAPAVAASCQFTCWPNLTCWPSRLEWPLFNQAVIRGPSNSEWQQFNQTIQGRLRKTEVMGSVCFQSSPDYDSQACNSVRQNYMSGAFRESRYGALESTNWESCGVEHCYPGVFAPQGETCSLGRLSPLYVHVETPDDIAATIKFTKKHDVSLVIKNTGHDYLGRSSAAGTVALWTFNMKNMSFESTFTPKDCPAAGTKKNIGIIEAGVTATMAIDFFHQYGMMFTAGGCNNIGLAGGFGQGGGHGPLSQTYGMMVDQAVEFDVVTADGVIRTINECKEPDLFWAMRGGGGGTFAVLQRFKFQLHPQTRWAVWSFEANINVDPNEPDFTKNDLFREALTHMANEQVRWSKGRMTGYTSFQPTALKFLEILPTHDDNALDTIKELTAKFNAWLSSHPGLTITANSYSVVEDMQAFYATYAAVFAHFDTSGLGVVAPTRLATTPDFESPEKIRAVVNGILDGLEAARQIMGGDLGQSIAFFILQTGASNVPDPHHATSAHPVWRQTHWHMIPVGIWLPGSPQGAIDQVRAAARAVLAEMKKPLAVQASYLNEADTAEEDWQSLFFGTNYDKLLAVKQKYDPDYVFRSWKGVGFTGEDDPVFSCYGSNPVPSVPFPFDY